MMETEGLVPYSC